MTALKSITLNSPAGIDCENARGHGGMIPIEMGGDPKYQDEFFGILNCLAPNQILDSLTLNFEYLKDQSGEVYVGSLPLSYFLLNVYTRKCKNTYIDLSKNRLMLKLDSMIDGFSDLLPKELI